MLVSDAKKTDTRVKIALNFQNSPAIILVLAVGKRGIKGKIARIRLRIPQKPVLIATKKVIKVEIVLSQENHSGKTLEILKILMKIKNQIGIEVTSLKKI